MRSITVRVVGGLGNQLHCYAFGRAVASQNEVCLKLDVESAFWNDPYGREYLLDQFPAINGDRYSYSPQSKFGRLLFKLGLRLGLIYSKLLPLHLRLVITENEPQSYQAEVHRTHYITDPYFIGYWASYRYYQDIATELRKELKPPIPTDPTVLDLLAQIQAAHSCFIHWRSYKEERGVKHPKLYSYYEDAIDIMSKKYPNLAFFIFSDDPIAARSEIPSSARQMTYVDLPAAKGNLQSLADFYLMYSCDHAIIGDSTFSWWAAWLSDQENKTIIAPKGLSPWGDDWLPPHWLTLNVSRKE